MKTISLRAKLSLIMVLIVSILSVTTVFAASYIQDGDWKFEKPSNNTESYYVAGYTGTANKIQIPALCQTKPVTKINNNAFLNRSELSYVGIPATIKSIGMNAFYGCSSIDGISIPASVTEIGANAFYGCSSLVNFQFKSDSELCAISQNTFSGCTSLSTISLPDSVTSIGKNAFFGCTSLSAVTFGPYVTEIDAAAFKNCPRITFFGWNNTYPQEFAKENNITFISLGDFVYTEPTNPVETTPPTEATQPDTNPTESTKYPEGKIYLIGDSDLSGRINVKDATLIQKYVADIENLDRTQLFLANCDSSGGVNVKDATQIQKYCAGYPNILFVGTEVEI